MRDDSAPAPEHATDEWARGLLLAAADTIEVRPEPRPFVPSPSPRRAWAYAAAAAASVVAVVGAVAMVGGGTPSTRPVGTPDPSLFPDPTPVEPPGPGITLADDQIPSVFGYDSASARAMLQNLGLGVTIDIVPSCDVPRRAVGTNPPVGTRFGPGDVVELQVTNGGDDGYCAPPSNAAVWPFLDFANGRGPAAEFAPEVTLTVNGVATTVTAAQAADPTSWPVCEATFRDCAGSALDVIRERSAIVTQMNHRWVTPSLSVQGGAETQRIWIGVPTDGIFGPQWQVTLHWQPLNSRPTSLLTGVDLRWDEPTSAPAPTGGDPATLPDLVGRFSDEAISELDYRGFEIQASTTESCAADGLVLAQSPEGGTPAAVGDVVTLLVNSRPSIDPGHCASAEDELRSLQRFARGAGDRAPVAEEVDLYLGNVFQKLITRAEAADPASWELCADYHEHPCPMSALTVLRDADGVTARPIPSEGCGGFLADLPTALRPTTPDVLERTAALESPEPPRCFDHWAVQLWNISPDRTAVNLILGDH